MSALEHQRLHRGMMGGRTPNIDRIAREGALFTDYYAQQSCTAGRAAFILGQTPFRTGLLKVGLPAAKQGLQDKDPTIAELLKPMVTPPRRSAKTISATATSTCLPCTASTSSTAFSITSTPWRSRTRPTIRRVPNSGRSSARATSWIEGNQRRRPDHRSALGQGRQADDRGWRAAAAASGHGPAAKVNMEDVDAELVRRSIDFMERSVKANKPFFLWHNSTRMPLLPTSLRSGRTRAATACMPTA